MPTFLAPFLVGVVLSPLAKGVVKPLLRGVVKGSVGLAIEVRRVAAEVTEEVQDLAAEAAADSSTVDAPAPTGAAAVPAGSAVRGRSGSTTR